MGQLRSITTCFRTVRLERGYFKTLKTYDAPLSSYLLNVRNLV